MGTLKQIKKHLASVNLTLALVVAGILAWRGVDPCYHLFKALTGVGVEDLQITGTGDQEDGPPAPASVILQLQDGQRVQIMENGVITVEGGAAGGG